MSAEAKSGTLPVSESLMAALDALVAARIEQAARKEDPYPMHRKVADDAVRVAQVKLTMALDQLAGAPIGQPSQPKLSVWFGAMPESNGKKNWTAILHRGDLSEGLTLDRSEYHDRVRYEADRARHLIGELAEEPDILAYDDQLRSPAGEESQRG